MDKYVSRVVGQLDKYLLAVEKGIPGSLPSGANMESTRTQRPGSRAPHKSYAERFLSDPHNAQARMCLEPALRYLKEHETELWYTLADEATSPGLKARLETVKSQARHPYPAPRRKDLPPSATEAQHRKANAEHEQAVREHERKKAEWKRLKKMAPEWLEKREQASQEVACFVVRWFPEEAENLKVNLDPEDEPVKSMREASEKDRRRNTEDSYRILAGKVEETMREEEMRGEKCSIKDAKGLVADRMDISFARVHRAWLFKLAEDREEKGA